MADMLDRLVAVWARVPTTDTRDEAAFRDAYADPVTLNGRDVPVSELVERNRGLHASFTDLDIGAHGRRTPSWRSPGCRAGSRPAV